MGTAAADLTEFVLRVDAVTIPLPRLTAPVAPGVRVLIQFDGRGTVEGNVVHSTIAGLRAEGGSIALMSNDERVFDRIAWGDAPGAIMPPTGGFAKSRVTPGSSFGRPPGADRPSAPTDWVIYPPDQVSPGRANPLPPVAQLLPMNGAILPATSAELSWYPVPGAARYRVQLAADNAFTTPLLNQVVDGTSVSSGQRAAGVYFWRVQAIPAEGAPSAWSYASRLELGRRSVGADGTRADRGPAGFGMSESDESPQAAGPVVLSVALIHQSKDSGMLLMESQQEGGVRTAGALPPRPHVWDRDHPGLDIRDPADNMNCALASMTMLNRFYNGDLTQDRIGYEVFSKNVDQYAGAIQARDIYPPTSVPQEKAPGPERDLNYGYGLSLEHVVAAGLFALGAAPGPGSGWAAPDDIWNAVVREINAGRPLLGFTSGHFILIRGYDATAGRIVYINDPWSGPNVGPGQYAVNLDASNLGLAPLAGFMSYPTHPTIRNLERNFNLDADGDGVTDFDEINRFKTDPNNTDTDTDGVPDKNDIKSGIYELEHMYGYAWNPAYGNPGRDLDSDNKPTELDPDSDDGGCTDGDEDTDKDGFHTDPETNNFDRADDQCGNLQGNLSWTEDMYGTDPIQVIKRSHLTGSITVKLKPKSPGSDHYVDDGSTFAISAYARVEVNLQGCVLFGQERAARTGRFTNPEDIGATRGDDGTLALGAKADDIVGHASGGGCGLPYGGSQIPFSMAFPYCDGKLAPNSPPGFNFYRFNCSDRQTLPGGLTTQIVAGGYVKLVKPRPQPLIADRFFARPPGER